MRKIRIIEQISLDGVIQAPGGRNEAVPKFRWRGRFPETSNMSACRALFEM